MENQEIRAKSKVAREITQELNELLKLKIKLTFDPETISWIEQKIAKLTKQLEMLK